MFRNIESIVPSTSASNLRLLISAVFCHLLLLLSVSPHFDLCNLRTAACFVLFMAGMASSAVAASLTWQRWPSSAAAELVPPPPQRRAPLIAEASRDGRHYRHASAWASSRSAAVVTCLISWRKHSSRQLTVRRAQAGLKEFRIFTSDDGEQYEFFPDKVLGSGAQGTVYRGVALRTGQPVAIKAIPTWRLLLDEHCEEKLASIDEELGTLRAIGSHVNIAGMISAASITREDANGVARPHYKLLVMELVDGRELAEHVALDGPMKESVARSVFLQVLDGLAHVHSRGVIHRDLKPENVLLTGEEATLESRVKLIDFGVAKCISNGPLKTVVGTPSIMAPEVARAKIALFPGSVDAGRMSTFSFGAPAAANTFSWGTPGSTSPDLHIEDDASSTASPDSEMFCPKIDVWSAGVCLFTCLTGKLPFRNEDPDHRVRLFKGPVESLFRRGQGFACRHAAKGPQKEAFSYRVRWAPLGGLL